MEHPAALSSPSVTHVRARVRILAERADALARARRAGDPRAADPLRGLAVTGADLDVGLDPVILATGELEGARRLVEHAADEAADGGVGLRLRQLARTSQLDDIDVDLLLTALVPELEPGAAPALAYLSGDPTAPRPTVGVALALLGLDVGDPSARIRLLPHGRLRRAGLLEVGPETGPLPRRALGAPDRLIGHLLGVDAPDPLVAPREISAVPLDGPDAQRLAAALRSGATLLHLRERPGGSAVSVAAGAAAALGVALLAVDARRIPTEELSDVLQSALLEARLRGGPLVVGPVEVLEELGRGAVDRLAGHHWPVVLSGMASWDPRWTATLPLALEIGPPDDARRRAVWSGLLDLDEDPTTAAAGLRLAPEDVARTTAAAHLRAAAEGRAPTLDDVVAAARALSGGPLEQQAARVRPAATFDDLVVTDRVLRRLRELTGRIRQAGRVLDEWGLRTAGRHDEGLTALFAGPPGTGKSMAAEALAADLGLDLWVIDLSSVVDKYVGETEKHLERIFSAAEASPGVLLFDEADALFGKRSGVSDARDRYANVEVSYLLQRLDRFTGLAILTTNLRSNLDDAFLRRFAALVDFPEPDAADRRRLWQASLGPKVPLATDVDLDALSKRFALTGGHIRTACLTAAHSARARGDELDMVDLIHGVVREYEKLGRVCSPQEFGPYYPWVEHA